MKVPTLRNSQLVVRVTRDPDEIARANWLVYENYVADGFWEDNKKQLETNKFLHSQHRTVFVVEEAGQILGTMSLIGDSEDGLPSDGTQLPLMQTLRKQSHGIAEVSAFAMDRSKTSTRRLMLFLISYMHQHAFYYAGMDRLVASCKPEHADFYEQVIGWSKVSDLTYYDYSHASGYLISLNLLDAHRILSEKYPPDPTAQSFYHFLLCDPHPIHRFAAGGMRRAREDWLPAARRRVA
jgi:hypothetical protein